MIYGLRFYRSSVKVKKSATTSPFLVHGRLDSARSDFDFIFSCLYEAVRDYVFVENTSEPFAAYGEEYWAHALQILPDKRSYHSAHKIGMMPAHVLERFGQHVSDDWNEAILFRQDAIGLERMADVTRAVGGKAFGACKAAQVILHNWDGVYWEIFCKDSSLTQHLLQSHRENQNLSIYKVDLKLDYPDPRDVPLEKA